MLLGIYSVTAMMHSNHMESKLSLTRHITMFSKWLLVSVIWKPTVGETDFNKQVSILHFFIALPYPGPHLSSYISRYFCVTSCGRTKFHMIMFTGKINVLLWIDHSTVHAIQFSPSTLSKYAEHKREVLTFSRWTGQYFPI